MEDIDKHKPGAISEDAAGWLGLFGGVMATAGIFSYSTPLGFAWLGLCLMWLSNTRLSQIAKWKASHGDSQ